MAETIQCMFPYAHVFINTVCKDHGDVYASLKEVLDGCKRGTLYSSVFPQPGKMMRGIDSEQLTSNLLIDHFIEAQFPHLFLSDITKEVCSVVRRSVREGVKSIKDALETKKVGSGNSVASVIISNPCPWAALFMFGSNFRKSIYDLDGIDYICWLALCVLSEVVPEKTLRNYITLTQQKPACNKLSSQSHTCTPFRAVSFLTCHQCYVPEALFEMYSIQQGILESDAVREAEIADATRSTRYCGPTMASVLAGYMSKNQQSKRVKQQQPQAAETTTTEISDNIADMAQKHGKQKQLRKFSDERQRREIETLASKQQSQLPQQETAQQLLQSTEEEQKKQASITAAQKVTQESISRSAIDDRTSRQVLDDAMFRTQTATDALRRTESTVIQQPKLKRGELRSEVRKEDEFGDPAFDSDRYSLEKFEDRQERQIRRLSATASHGDTLCQFLTKAFGLQYTHKTRNDIVINAIRTVWSDIAMIDTCLQDPYSLAMPCGCTTELITLVVSEVEKLLVGGENNWVHSSKCIEEQCINARLGIPAWSVSPDMTRSTIRTYLLDLAFGTIPSILVNSKEHVTFVTALKEKFRNEIPSALSRVFSQYSRPLSWRPGVIHKGNLVGAITTGTPFDEFPPRKRGGVCSGEETPASVITDTQPGIIRLWSHLFRDTKNTVIEQQRDHEFVQAWKFVPINYIIRSVDQVTRTFACGLHTRAIEMAAATMYAGNLFGDNADEECGDSDAQTELFRRPATSRKQLEELTHLPQGVVFSPSAAWPCDVCFTCTLASSALQVRQVSVGLAVVAQHGQTYVALPNRKYRERKTEKEETDATKDNPLIHITRDPHPCNAKFGHPSDGIVFGTVLHALGGVSVAKPTIVGCDLIFPLAFSILFAAGAAKRADAEEDDAIRIARAAGNRQVVTGRSRDQCWDKLLRAAVVYLSNTTTKFFKEELKNIPETETEIPNLEDDNGAVSEDFVNTGAGWIPQQVQIHQKESLRIYYDIAKLLVYALSTETIKTMRDAISVMRGVACLARPLRAWTVTTEALERLVLEISHEATAETTTPDQVPINTPLKTLQEILATKQAERLVLDKSIDMAGRTRFNSAILQMLLDCKNCDCVAKFLSSLCLAPYSRDHIRPPTKQCSVESLSCAQGEESALPPWGVELEQAKPPHEYDDSYDGANVPSFELLSTEFISSYLLPGDAHVNKQTVVGSNVLLEVLRHMEITNRKIATTTDGVHSATVKTILNDIDETKRRTKRVLLPLALRTCNWKFLHQDEFSLVADNPLTTSANFHVCSTCSRTVESNDRAQKRVDKQLSTHFLANLPKSSALASELAHYRNGVVVMHPAWPSKDTTTTTQDQKCKHIYAAEVLKSVPLTIDPTGHVVQQEQQCSFSGGAHEDEVRGEFSLDPDTFDAVMRAETAEVGRAQLAFNRIQK